MTDEAGEDTKVITVPVDKIFPTYRGIREARELPELTLERIAHFFQHYKDLEKGKWVKIEGWKDAQAARQEILEGVKRFKAMPAQDRPRF